MSFSESCERTAMFQDHVAATGVFGDITLLPGPPESTTWWRAQRHRLHFASHFVTQYRYPQYRREISECVRKKCAGPPAVDLVYVDTLKMTQYTADVSHLPAVVDLHDCLTLLCRREARMERNPLRRVSMALEAWGIARLEKPLHRRFHTVITNSEVDASSLRSMAPETRVVTLPNGVDAEYFSVDSVRENPNRAVFTGVMSYGPNHDAVVHFCQDIHPIIRASLGEFEFYAVGHGPPPVLQHLSEPGVHVTGSVPDVRPWIASAPVFVSPLRYGSGMKNKILAAMAMGRAVVATPVSMEGIEARDGYHLVVAATPTEFAKEVVRLLENPDEARALGENGRRLVLERYSWASRGETLHALLASITGIAAG
jgi:glycosyltransferase involved in cell wall biosynthesis